MATTQDDHAAAQERFVPEMRWAMAEAEFPVQAWPPRWHKSGHFDYLYRPGSILTRTSDARQVTDALHTAPALKRYVRRRGWKPTFDAPASGLTRVSFDVHRAHHTVDTLEHVEEQLGPGVVAHEHVFGVAHWISCPPTEPHVRLRPQDASKPKLVAGALWPPQSTGSAGEDVHISVVDTGLLRDVARWAPWLAGVTANTKADIDKPRSRRYADPYTAHGSFVAGVIRCVAPASNVVVERMIGRSGFVAETDMIRQIRDGLSRSPGIINLSAGGYTRKDVPPFALSRLWRDELSQQGVVLVAAAGNNASERPFWPAAFDWCIGVGSMTRDGQHRSWFSNYGSWVDVYAPGEDLVNAYARRKYKTIVKHKVRDTRAGIAKWSGTSFATPVVAALIAARMSNTRENGRTAADAVLAAAGGPFRQGVGPRLFP